MERNLFNNMQAIFSTYRYRFLKAFVMVLISNCLLIGNPLVFRQAIMAMDVSFGQPNHVFRSLLGGHLATWVILLLFMSLVSAFFKYRMRVAFISISRDAEKEIRSKLFVKIQSQSMAFYDQHGIGELLSRLTNDISAYRDVLGPGIMYPLFFLTLVLPGLFALFYIAPQLATLSLVPLFAIPIINVVMRRRVYQLSHQVQKGLADLSNMTQEHYSGVRLIKGYAAEEEMTMSFRQLCRRLVGLNIRLDCFQGMLFPFFTMLTKMITILLVICFGFLILQAWRSLSAADFVSFMWIQSYLFFPVLMVAWVLPLYQRGRAAYDRLLEIYNEPIEVVDRKDSDLSISKRADIEFKELTFCYPKTSFPALSDFSLKIKGGSFVGITGPVGCGKTTLFKLLSRDYEVPVGKLLIGGVDIRNYPLSAFSQEMVVVEQMPFLFSRSIAENVSFGKEGATKAEIESVAKYADLHDSVLTFPEQYATQVGERGVTLSGGQKQRLAIARAFLVNRSILLLDDVFSAVDTATENKIFKALQANFKDHTILLITHRVSVLSQTDRIIYMSGGKVIEDGSPQELFARGGPYAALVELQHLHHS